MIDSGTLFLYCRLIYADIFRERIRDLPAAATTFQVSDPVDPQDSSCSPVYHPPKPQTDPSASELPPEYSVRDPPTRSQPKVQETVNDE